MEKLKVIYLVKNNMHKEHWFPFYKAQVENALSVLKEYVKENKKIDGFLEYCEVFDNKGAMISNYPIILDQTNGKYYDSEEANHDVCKGTIEEMKRNGHKGHLVVKFTPRAYTVARDAMSFYVLRDTIGLEKFLRDKYL